MIDVLQVITTNDRRGAEVFAHDLGDALIRRGRTVRTVALAPTDHEAGLDVTILGTRRLGAGTLLALRAEARQARIVLAHGSSTLPACALATAGTRMRFIYRNIGDPTHWGTAALRRARSALLLRRATAVVALTPSTARQLTRLYRVHANKMRSIPKGVPADRFVPADAEKRARARVHFHLRGDTPVVLYIGALSPEKNVAMAIDAVAALPDVHLLIVGDGPDRQMLEDHADLRAPTRVSFAGATNDPATAYAAADAVVLPSISEGLPGVLIEAGFSGLPVVATDVGFVSDIVADYETGFLVPTGDTDALTTGLGRALSKPELGEAARAHCLARFELSLVAARWDDLIEETLRVSGPTQSRFSTRREARLRCIGPPQDARN
jgi:glycosyltransferase involved in cell wall biosynthesis